MREIGSLNNEDHAKRFQAWLQTQSINSQVEPDGEKWSVWVYDEDRLDAARSELTAFRGDPNSGKYSEAETKAAAIEKAARRKAKAAKKRTVNARDRWNQPMASAAPVTFTLIGLSLLTVMFTTNWDKPPSRSLFNIYRFADREMPILHYLWIAEFQDEGGRLQYLNGEFVYKGPFAQIARGQIWRFVTPIFIHLSLVHVIFNMMFLRSIGPPIEFVRGRWRYVSLVLAIAVCSNVGQLLSSGPAFGGMSGVLYGLFGFAWTKSRFDPSAGIYVDPNTAMWLTVWFFMCLFGFMGPIANGAHGFGALTGAVIAYAPVLWRKIR